MDGAATTTTDEVEAGTRASRPSLIDALARGGATRRPLAATGLFLIALCAALYVGRAVLVPLALAFMLSFIFNPVVRALHRLYVPKAIGSALVVLGLVGGLVVGAVALADPASDWATRLPYTLMTIEHKVQPLKKPVDEANKLAARVEKLTDTSSSPVPVREVKLQEAGLASLAGIPGPFIAAWSFGWGINPASRFHIPGIAFFEASALIALALVLAMRTFRRDADAVRAVAAGMSEHPS